MPGSDPCSTDYFKKRLEQRRLLARLPYRLLLLPLAHFAPSLLKREVKLGVQRSDLPFNVLESAEAAGQITGGRRAEAHHGRPPDRT